MMNYEPRNTRSSTWCPQSGSPTRLLSSALTPRKRVQGARPQPQVACKWTCCLSLAGMLILTIKAGSQIADPNRKVMEFSLIDLYI